MWQTRSFQRIRRSVSFRRTHRGSYRGGYRTLRTAGVAIEPEAIKLIGYSSGVTERQHCWRRGRASVGRTAEPPGGSLSFKEAFRYVEERSLGFAELVADQGHRSFSWQPGCWQLGIQPQDRVAIASSTRMEWVLADLAIMSAAGATTTIYPSTQRDDVRYVLADSQSKGGDRRETIFRSKGR